LKILACKTPRGSGGMGSHFDQIIREGLRDGRLDRYYSTSVPEADKDLGVRVSDSAAAYITRWTPIRYSPGRIHFVGATIFDRAVARRLEGGVEVFGGFAGQTLHSASRAKELGATSIELHSATAHAATSFDRFQDATAQWRIEPTWLNARMVAKQVREYEIADRIYVNSEYSRRTFLDHGVPETKLVRTYLATNPRFDSATRSRTDSTFRVVYTGGLSVAKGVPVLLEAFSRFRVQDAELVLIGGWSTRAMRRYLEAARRSDPRVRITLGDPLPILVNADVYVHPSYQDGYGYAPMEALACGLKLIVTEDTGMKENIVEGQNGYVVKTGSADAILDRLNAIHAAS
jgi:glycosyltransferase involved in cell wall biosynthesis